jgi:hypothetical protein
MVDNSRETHIFLLKRTSDFNEFVLLNNIFHILLFLLTLQRRLAQLGYLVGDAFHALGVLGAEGEAPDKLRRRVLERMVLFPPNALARRQEINAQVGVLALGRLVGVFDGVDVEGHGPAHDGQDDSQVFGVDDDGQLGHLGRQLVVALVRLEAFERLLRHAVLHALGVGKTAHARLLALLGQLLLELAALLDHLLVRLFGAAAAQPGLGDVCGGHGPDPFVLLLFGLGRRRLLVILCRMSAKPPSLTDALLTAGARNQIPASSPYLEVEGH